MTDRPHSTPSGEHLGPWPEATVVMFEDLGLAEHEIARHLRIDPRTVRDLRQRARAEDVLPPWFDPPQDAANPPDPPAPAPRWRCCARLRALLERFCRG
jgi:hypothetical protein